MIFLISRLFFMKSMNSEACNLFQVATAKYLMIASYISIMISLLLWCALSREHFEIKWEVTVVSNIWTLFFLNDYTKSRTP